MPSLGLAMEILGPARAVYALFGQPGGKVADGRSVRSSEELASVAERFYRAMGAADRDTLRNLLSSEPCTLAIGTDPGEWWRGSEGILDIWCAQRAESGSFTLELRDAEAWTTGDFG